MPLTTSCTEPADSATLTASGLVPVCVPRTAPSDPYTVSVSGEAFENVSVAAAVPDPVARLNARELFLVVAAPLKVVVAAAGGAGAAVDAGDGVGASVGEGLGEGVGVAVAEGAALGAGVIVGDGDPLAAGAPSARSVP